MTRTLPPWHAALAGSETLAELGFRFLPNHANLPASNQIRVGDIGGFGAATSRGIGLIWRSDEPAVLYARFADEHDATLTPEVNEPETSLGGSAPLVEVPIEPTQNALVDLHRRYVEPGSGLPTPGPLVHASLNHPGERVRCHHEEFKRLRVPLGLIAAEDPEDPEATIDDVVELERGLIFNGFLTMYQWTLHSGQYRDSNGEPFSTPYTTMETLFSRSLVSIDCRYSWAGCHLTLEVDYPAEPARSSVAALLSRLDTHWPDNDQLPDDLPYDVVGAIAALGIQLQSAATQREWLAEGDDSTLISRYLVAACDDHLTDEGVNERVRELLTPYARSPHPEFRELVVHLAKEHQLADLAEQ